VRPGKLPRLLLPGAGGGFGEQARTWSAAQWAILGPGAMDRGAAIL